MLKNIPYVTYNVTLNRVKVSIFNHTKCYYNQHLRKLNLICNNKGFEMFTLKKLNDTYLIKFELDYTYPTHKEIINDIFSEAIKEEKNKIVIDLSKVKIIDISSFRSMLNGIMRARNLGKEITLVYPQNEKDTYVSKIYELSNIEEFLKKTVPNEKSKDKEL